MKEDSRGDCLPRWVFEVPQKILGFLKIKRDINCEFGNCFIYRNSQPTS